MSRPVPVIDIPMLRPKTIQEARRGQQTSSLATEPHFALAQLWPPRSHQVRAPSPTRPTPMPAYPRPPRLADPVPPPPRLLPPWQWRRPVELSRWQPAELVPPEWCAARIIQAGENAMMIRKASNGRYPLRQAGVKKFGIALTDGQ